ncbi:MAG: PilW family protein [Betaproteobacteria bacterium]
MKTQRGFSLIDILVGMVIGLIGMIVVFQSFNAFEAQKRTTTVADDAQESGLMALAMIGREIQLAGYGMFYAGTPVCNGMRQWTGAAIDAIASFPPVVIGDGATNASDTLTLTYSTSGFGSVPSQLISKFDGSAAQIQVDNPTGGRMYETGDFVLVGGAGKTCTRLQVSAVAMDTANPLVATLSVASGSATPANPPSASLASLLPTGGYVATANTLATLNVVSNMGQMRRTRYSVTLDGTYGGRLQSLDVNTTGATAVDLGDGIVNLQAQYGISTAESVQQVSSWVNATGSWVSPAFTDQGRIKALRIAVVARSQLRERDEVQGVTMTCTNVSGTNANGPCAWRDTAASPAPLIDLSANTDWRRYRYRVYETIVPLRNVMWQY